MESAQKSARDVGSLAPQDAVECDALAGRLSCTVKHFAARATHSTVSCSATRGCHQVQGFSEVTLALRCDALSEVRCTSGLKFTFEKP
jgi:hypothetical protein